MPLTIIRELPPMRPAAVLLDLDDTLYAYEPSHKAGLKAARATMLEEAGLGRERFDAAYEAARARVKGRLGAAAAAHSRLLYFHEMLEGLGMRSQPALALALEAEYWRGFLLAASPLPGVESFLLALRYHAVPIAVVTDLTLAIQLRKLVHLRLAELVDHVVASEEVFGGKKTLAPYRLAAERLGLDPQTALIWMIGDDRVDVVSVKEVFPKATVFLRRGAEAAELEPLADAAMDDFVGMADLPVLAKAG